VHRREVLEAGATERQLRAALTLGLVTRERRYWVATASAPPLLRAAARATARVACVSVAVLRGWWIPPGVDARPHLAVRAHAEPPPGDVVAHWSRPLVPVPATSLVESVPDALEHIAGCLPRADALVLWESAARVERWAPESLARVGWRTVDARDTCAVVTGQSDSGLETIVVDRVRAWGLPLRQQAWIAGHPVDLLIGDRLIVQLDGFAYHARPADRARDLAHDRELVARGYTVLRFTYAEVVHGWAAVEQALVRAIAQGLHLAA
jgi:very-short-patch-repair endonuclease